MIVQKLTRTFHAVGQGGFYSERHGKFNIVYDCGAIPSHTARMVVQSHFSKNDTIDTLFISHLDYDHVSAITALQKSVKSIRAVILPLLDDKHINLLVNINRVLSQNIIKLLTKPHSIFGKDTKIIYVEPADSEQNDLDTVYNLSEDLPRENNNGRIKIKSGSKLGFGSNPDWVFIPYNFLNKTRSSQLINELNKTNLDINRLQNEADYTLKCILNNDTRKKLRQIYSHVEGNVNENSMLLYSGPEKRIFKYIRCECDHFCYCRCCNYRVGCIYTGDCDLNKIDLGTIYYKFVSYIGTIQIPHHGSRRSFSINSLRDFRPDICCPLSFGTKNTYGHPSPHVINDLSQHRFRPFFINEDPASEYIQKFTMFY